MEKGAPGEACMEAKARTCAGMQDVSTCVVKQNREITPGDCKKETSLLVHLGRARQQMLRTPGQAGGV